MGFLSSIAGAAIQVGAGLLFGQPAVAPAAAVLGRAALTPIIGPTTGTAAAVAAAAGGNGVTHLRTVVQSIDNATGSVIRENVMEGSPFLMNKDMQIARKVFKMIGMANKRLPKKMVRVSATTMLKDQLVDSSLQAAISHNAHHTGHQANG